MKTNIIYNKDCIEGMKELPDESVDCIITDPPYGCNATMKGNYNDDEDFIKTQLPIWFNQFKRVLKSNCYTFIYVPSLYLENWLIESKKHFKLLNILSVENMKVGRQYKDRFRNNCQLILVLSKGKPKGFNQVDWILTSDSWFKDKRNPNPKRYTSTYPSYIPNYYKATVEKNHGHNDEKNHLLIEKFIEIVTNNGEIVLDPFIGSGTIAVACINTNRQFIGYEIDPQYYKLSLDRLSDKTSTLPNGNPNGEFNKDLTATQQVASPKSASQTSLNPILNSIWVSPRSR
jgi:site-specific DNA-methyltransferase (adenine-specific)